MGPTPEVPQESISTLPKPCAESSSQKQAYSTSGSFEQLQYGPDDARLVNTRLVEKLRAVVIMNDKWQRYNKQQEKYRKDLELKLQQERLMREEAEKRYSQAKNTQRLQEQKLNQQEETIKCFSSLMEELDQAKIKIKRLEEEMKDARLTSEQNRNQDQDEKVKLLQYQLQVCIDDFNREQSEKEKLQHTVKSLQAKIVDVNHLLTEYQKKVNMMKAIPFPTIHNGNPDEDNHHCQNEKPTVHRRRIKMSSSAPTRSNLTCRLDGINFPTNIEADFAKHSSRGCDLAPNFSMSLEAEETVEPEPFDESLEMVRH